MRRFWSPHSLRDRVSSFGNDRKSRAVLFCGGRSRTGAIVSALKICRLEVARRCLSAGADRDTHLRRSSSFHAKAKGFFQLFCKRLSLVKGHKVAAVSILYRKGASG